MNSLSFAFGPGFRSSTFTTEDFDSILGSSQAGYPYFNILQPDDNTARIELAVAGWTSDELDVQLVPTESGKHEIIITGSHKTDENKYQYRGIAKRDFKRVFVGSRFIEITSVALENGILTVDIVKNIPEEQKPKSFKIKT